MNTTETAGTSRRDHLCKLLGFAIGIPLLAIFFGGFALEVFFNVPFLDNRLMKALLGIFILAYGLWIRSFTNEVAQLSDRIMNRSFGTINFFGSKYRHVSYDTDAHKGMARVGGAFAILLGIGLMIVAVVNK